MAWKRVNSGLPIKIADRSTLLSTVIYSDGTLTSVTSEDGNKYTWNATNIKWEVASNNIYNVTTLPTATNFYIKEGTVVFDTDTNSMKKWKNGWLSVNNPSMTMFSGNGDPNNVNPIPATMGIQINTNWTTTTVTDGIDVFNISTLCDGDKTNGGSQPETTHNFGLMFSTSVSFDTIHLYDQGSDFPALFYPDSGPNTGRVYISNNGTTWTLVKTITIASNKDRTIALKTPEGYARLTLSLDSVTTAKYVIISWPSELRCWYGSWWTYFAYSEIECAISNVNYGIDNDMYRDNLTGKIYKKTDTYWVLDHSPVNNEVFTNNLDSNITNVQSLANYIDVRYPTTVLTANYTVTLDDLKVNKRFKLNNTVSITITLPTSTVAENNKYIDILKIGTGDVTILTASQHIGTITGTQLTNISGNIGDSVRIEYTNELSMYLVKNNLGWVNT